MMFAKLYETSLGQVVVLRQSNNDGEPEIRFYYEPEGLGVSSMAFCYTDDEDGWQGQQEGFEKITLEMAEVAVKQLSNICL